MPIHLEYLACAKWIQQKYTDSQSSVVPLVGNFVISVIISWGFKSPRERVLPCVMWNPVCTTEFSLRWYLYAQKSPYVLHPPHLSENSPMPPLEQFQCLSDRWWPTLVLSQKIIECFLFQHLSPPGGWWCEVLGFVHTGALLKLLNTSDLSVSSSSTLQLL